MKLCVSGESMALEAVLAELLEHLPKLSLEVRQLALDRLQGLLQAGCIDVVTLAATDTCQVRIAFEPSKALLGFAAAVRAGNVDLL